MRETGHTQIATVKGVLRHKAIYVYLEARATKLKGAGSQAHAHRIRAADLTHTA